MDECKLKYSYTFIVEIKKITAEEIKISSKVKRTYITYFAITVSLI